MLRSNHSGYMGSGSNESIENAHCGYMGSGSNESTGNCIGYTNSETINQPHRGLGRGGYVQLEQATESLTSLNDVFNPHLFTDYQREMLRAKEIEINALKKKLELRDLEIMRRV